MRVKLSKNAGFCFGVNRAVNTVFGVLNSSEKCCSLGPVVHNSGVINKFKERGGIIVNEVENAPNGYTLVIRAHGIGLSTFNKIKELKLKFIDATCPFVKKIHRIVSEYSKKGFLTLIAGNPLHAEVKGIIGNCFGDCFVFKDSSELYGIIKSLDATIKNCIVVSQTTFSTTNWSNCVKLLKELKPGFGVFNTICKTTELRQKEAESLAKKVDLMVVIGGKNSSNSLKLKEVCEKHCKTYFIESAKELCGFNFNRCKIIGITAGASVPSEDIVEVKKVLEEMNENNIGNDECNSCEQSCSGCTGGSTDEPSYNGKNEPESIVSGETLEGTVVELLPNEVKVDIGRKYYGTVPLTELTTDLSKNTEDLVHVGEKLSLVVVNIDEASGTVILSKKQADYSNGWGKVVEAYNNSTVLNSRVTEVVRGGVKLVHSGVKIFIPASLSGSSRNDPIEDFKGREIDFIIIELDTERKRAVGSCKAAKEKLKKTLGEAFWNKAKVGDTVEGTVTGVSSFGAFVDLGGIEGLVHISELSWSHINSAADVVKVGQKIKTVIKDLDKARGRVSLSYKRTLGDPWDVFVSRYSEGQIITCKITAVKDFGAFAEIVPGVEGMIHVSQISEGRIEKPDDVLTVGDEVRVKIMELDPVRRKVGLSIKNCYSIS